MYSKGPLGDISPMGIRRNSSGLIANDSSRSPRISQSAPDHGLGVADISQQNENVRPSLHDSRARLSSKIYSGTSIVQSSRRTSLEQLQKASRVRNSNFSLNYGSRNDDVPADQPHLENVIVSDTKLETSMPDLKRSTLLSVRHSKTVSFDLAPPQVNEYDMGTPDLSSVTSGSREGSYESNDMDVEESVEWCDAHSIEDNNVDDSFDESLEDVDKTPVVLPGGLYDVSSKPHVSDGSSITSTKSSSRTSDDSMRPLPPLPTWPNRALSTPTHPQSEQTRPLSTPRFESPKCQLPRPASISKADILCMRHTTMPMGERLRLLELQEKEGRVERERLNVDSFPSDCSEEQSSNDEISKASPTASCAQETVTPTLNKPPKISRTSILRNVEADTGSPPWHLSSLNIKELDPDHPIQSCETTYRFQSHLDGNFVEAMSAVDMVSMPGLTDGASPLVKENAASSGADDDLARESSVIRHSTQTAVTSNERYDRDITAMRDRTCRTTNNDVAEQQLTTYEVDITKDIGLPDMTPSSAADFGLSMEAYLSPSSSQAETSVPLTMDEHHRLRDPSRNWSPDNQDKQSLEAMQLSNGCDQEQPVSTQACDAFLTEKHTEHFVSQEDATVRAPGTTLRARLSIIPTDHASSSPLENPSFNSSPTEIEHAANESYPQQRLVVSRDNDMPCLAASDGHNNSASLSLDDGLQLEVEFDRLMKAQHVSSIPQDLAIESRDSSSVLNRGQKGYLTRHNTKLVVASSHVTIDERRGQDASKSGQSEILDSSHDRSVPLGPLEDNLKGVSSCQTWTTEPWNGRMRRQSTRKTNGRSSEKLGAPLSARARRSLEQLNVNSVASAVHESSDRRDSDERGRLFVKVNGVRNLDLPLAESEKLWFQLTLDNGLHCVTTARIKLARAAAIGQEFELTVFKDLEFQLTLQTELPRQAAVTQTSETDPVTKSGRGNKTSALTRFLTSPKKRRELERRQRQDEVLKSAADPCSKDQCGAGTSEPLSSRPIRSLIGADGSFARSYVSLKDYETQAFGRALPITVPCYNEWASHSDLAPNSTQSKLGSVQRIPPYQIGELDMHLLYLPKIKSIKDEELPQSMSACIKQLRLAEKSMTRKVHWEGHLSQQGGDCPYWRRRFFRLDGESLVSYHETTRQRRANINLAKATRLVDDRSTLSQSSGSAAKEGGRRRKSAFAEDEEGYMFVEEGFRIRFSNGEVIDFYADNADDKRSCMASLSEAIRRDCTDDTFAWARFVLQERTAMHQGALTDPPLSTACTPPTPLSLAEKHRPYSAVVALTESENDTGTARLSHRKAVRSMAL